MVRPVRPDKPANLGLYYTPFCFYTHKCCGSVPSELMSSSYHNTCLTNGHKTSNDGQGRVTKPPNLCGEKYRIARNFRGWKLSRISWYCRLPRKFYPRSFSLAQPIIPGNRQSAKVLFAKCSTSPNLWKFLPTKVSGCTIYSCHVYKYHACHNMMLCMLP